ncbi:Hsp20/alpha crystallin family protein [Salinibaculum salinum]|uniref:Hsp20/alpha crystallin family protein n=1 Tax=Salinibaculum salinum TaxID=3131996 RepID=UPI0030EFA112
MIRELGETIGGAVVESVGRAVARTQEQRPLDVDLLESDDAYLAVFDAPGVESGDVQVRFDDRTVIVRVDRFREFHEGYEMRFPGRGLSLDGSVELPADAAVEPGGATATLKENGTLQVEIPKVEGSDERIDVSTESAVDDTTATEPSDTGGVTDDRDDDEN